MTMFRLVLHAEEPFAPEAPADDGGALPAQAEGVDDVLALQLFRRAGRLAPGDPDYYFIVGQALSRMGRHEQAVAACREAVSLNPREPEYHCGVGEALWELGRFEEAEAAFRESLDLAKGEPRALNGLAATLLRTDRPEAAVRLLEEGLRRDARTPELQANLGVALWEMGRAREAFRAFRKAVASRPDEAAFSRNLLRALRAAGHQKEAIAFLRGSARRRPRDAGPHLDLAEVLHDAGRYREAEAAIERACLIDPASLAAHPRAREIRDTFQLRRIRDEVKTSNRQGPWGRLLSASGDVREWMGHSLLSLPRVLVTVALVILTYGALRLAPAYWTRFLLADDIAEIAHAPIRSDADVLDRLMHAVRHRGLQNQLREASFEIQTRPRWRTIICQYEVPVAPLPGVIWRLRFRIEVERPYVVEPDPIHL